MFDKISMVNILVLIVFSIFFFLAIGSVIKDGIKGILKAIRFKKTGLLTTGIIEVREQFIYTDSEGDKWLKDRYNLSFTTKKDVLVEAKAKELNHYCSIGIKVDILYLDDNPNDFLVDDVNANDLLTANIFQCLIPIFFVTIFFIIIIALGNDILFGAGIAYSTDSSF